WCLDEVMSNETCRTGLQLEPCMENQASCFVKQFDAENLRNNLTNHFTVMAHEKVQQWVKSCQFPPEELPLHIQPSKKREGQSKLTWWHQQCRLACNVFNRTELGGRMPLRFHDKTVVDFDVKPCAPDTVDVFTELDMEMAH